MHVFTLRPWGLMDQILQWIGRVVSGRLKRRNCTAEQCTAYAMAGGALVCAVVGAIAGFAFSDSSRNINVIDGSILGALLGVCIGVTFGAFVETVDHAIRDGLNSLDSK